MTKPTAIDWLQAQPVFDYFKGRILGRMYDVEEYFQEMHRMLGKKQLQLDQSVEEYLKTLDGEQLKFTDKSDFWEDYQLYDAQLPQLAFQSIVILVYSSYEFALHELCKIVQTMAGLPQGPARNNIYAYKDYLTENCEIDFPEGNWNEIDNIRVVRNAIAHYNGTVSDDYSQVEQLKSFITPRSDISIGKWDEILPKYEFCVFQISEMKTHLESTIEKTRVKFPDIE